MSFKLPTFNLNFNLWRAYNFSTSPMPPIAPPTLTTGCQLRPTLTALQQNNNAPGGPTAVLLVPKLTDIRPVRSPIVGDMVEVPAGSGRFYHVQAVEDRAKGFANEHRVAVLEQILQTAGGWPFPTP